MQVRIATEDDAESACLILRRSIVELCTADHNGDAERIRGWLANKTPENVVRWIRSDRQRVLTAEEDGEILGVSAGTANAEVLLNYVSPDAQYRGVSKAMLAALEKYFREMGNMQSTLTSTRTAYQFYVAAGYEVACGNELTEPSNGTFMVKPL